MVDPKNSNTSTRTLPPIPAKPVAAKPQTPSPASIKKPANFSTVPFWMGLALSVLWTAVVAMVLVQSGAAHTFGGLPLINWAIGISAIVSPVALIWMVTAYLQRAADVQSVAEPLRRQLMMITGESGAAEVRIRRFNQAIREQLELLRSTQSINHDDLIAIMDRVRQHKSELEQFEQHSVYQVKEIQEVIRRSMQHIEHLMEDKFTMLRILDGKLVQSGDSVARQTESVREQLTSLLQDIEANTELVGVALERSLRDGKKLADTARAQETSLVSAAESASSTLQEMSGKIDINIAHFLERAGIARSEAEHLASALDTQTRALDEFSNTLPARVSEAETVLRGVADRLHASEQLAREQAVHLSEKLAGQVDSLQSVLDRFGEKLSTIDGGFQQRRNDLDGLVVRISGATEDLAQQLETSISDLGDKAQSTMKKYVAVNDEARRGADDIAAQLAETAERYEAATKQLHGISEASSAQIRGVTQEIADQLGHFDALRNASQLAGQEVEARAGVAMQNLQNMLERLLAAREATQSVGETLTDKLYSAVDQNEKIITRINEAAQMTVHALGIATESLVRQEGQISSEAQATESAIRTTIVQLQEQAQTAEKSIRLQNADLTALLKETQEKLDVADERLQAFANTATRPVLLAVEQIDMSAKQGLESLDNYGHGMQDQLGRLQQLNVRVSGMGEEVGRMTSETLSSIESLNNRFLTVRAAQEETARTTLEQFGSVADRLQREVVGLNDQASQAVGALQKAANQVSQQAQSLHLEAQDSGNKIQMVTSVLQTEAAQVRAVLQKQADDLNVDLSRAEQQFAVIGESLKVRTDSAYALLDRIAAHYNEATKAATDEFENKAGKLDQVATSTIGKVQNLSSTLSEQLGLIGNGSAQLENQATLFAASSSKTLQQLSSLNEKFTVTQESTMSGSQQAINRLEEVNSAFQRQNTNLTDAAQNAAVMVQKAGASFGEQASKMMDTSHQVEQNIRSLNAATTAFADQASQIRSAMEQHNQRLISNLNESVGQIDATNARLQQTVVTATTGADQASTRFTELTQNASARISSTSKELIDIANSADTTLQALGASITQQVASMNVVGEQLSEQHRALTAANDSQRTQLVDLFDKLGSAHGQASEVAERTIARLTDSLQQIQRQLGQLSDQSQATVGNVRTATTGFADQAGLLLQNAQQAEQQARTVLSVTSALQDQARQLREALHAEGERTSEVLGSLLGKLSSGNAELRDFGSSTELTLTSLQQNVGTQAAALSSSMQQIFDRQRSLTTALDAQRDVLNGLLSRLTLAQDETASTAERTAARINDGSQQITRQMEAIDAQAQNTLVSVRNAAAGFSDEAGNFNQYAQQAEQQARSMHSNVAALQEQARTIRETIEGESERANEALNAIVGKLGAGHSELRNVGASAEITLSSIQGLVQEQVSALSSSMQQVSDRQRVLTGELGSQRETLDGLLSRLNLAQDETAATAERSAARITESAEDITRKIEAMEAQTKSSASAITIAAANFNEESASLSQSAEKAEQQTQQMFSTATVLQEQAKHLRDTVENDSIQTREIMGTLLGKLKDGSVEIRDLGAQAEASLSSLHNRVQEQTAALTSNMQQVSERQRELTSSLDSQRETLNALVNRLTLAQDDTSATAERNVARLTDSAQQITKQIEAIEAQAQNAITSVRATNAGFVDEAGNLSMHAQQVEQQARGMLSVTAGMQDQARQLRQSMQEESAQVIAHLGQVVAQMDVTGQQLKQQSSTIVHTMDQSVLEFTGLAKTTRETLQEQAEVLSNVAEQAEARVIGAGEKIRSHFKVVSEAGELTEQQARQLADTAEYATARLVKLLNTLAESDKDGSEVLAKASTRIEEVKATLQQELEQVAHISQVAVQQVMVAGQYLMSHSDTLRANLATSESALEQAATLVRDETVQIPGVLDRSTAQIEATGKRFKEHAEEIDGSIIKTADRFIGVTGAIRDTMMEELRNLTTVAATADHTLRQFNQALVEQVAAIHSGNAKLSDEQFELVEKSSSTIAQLAAASERLTGIRAETLQTTEKLVREFDAIESRTSSTTERLVQVGDVIGKQVVLLAQTTERAEGQMSSSTQSFREQMERIRSGVQMQIDDINRGLMQITAQLERTGTTLRSATAGTVADVEKISTRFDQTSKETAHQLSDRTARMRVATEEVAKLLSGFGDQIDVLLDRLSMAGDGIKRHESDLIGQLQVALSHLSTVSEKLESNRILTADVSDEAVARLSEVAAAVEKQMHDLKDGSQTVTGIVKGVGQMYTEQAQGMNRSVVDAQTQVIVMNKSIEEMQQRTDRMRVALKMQGDDLLGSLEQILQQLSRMSDGMSDAVDGVIGQQAEQNLKKIGS